MGQYHLICNLDRKELIHPHAFNEGMKLMEFAASGGGAMTGLAILLAGSVRGGARGGGDFGARSEIAKAVAGRWAGDRVAIVGDYHKAGDVCGETPETLAAAWEASDGWVDISEHVLAAMRDDGYLAGVVDERVARRVRTDPIRSAYDAAADRFVPVARDD